MSFWDPNQSAPEATKGFWDTGPQSKPEASNAPAPILSPFQPEKAPVIDPASFWGDVAPRSAPPLRLSLAEPKTSASTPSGSPLFSNSFWDKVKKPVDEMPTGNKSTFPSLAGKTNLSPTAQGSTSQISSDTFYRDATSYLFNPKAETDYPKLPFTTPEEQAQMPKLKGPRIINAPAKAITSLFTSVVEGVPNFLVRAQEAQKVLRGDKTPVSLPFNPSRIGLDSPDKKTVTPLGDLTLKRVDALDQERPNTPNLNLLQAFGEHILPTIINGFITGDVAKMATQELLSFTASSPTLGLSSQAIKDLPPQDAFKEVSQRFVDRGNEIIAKNTVEGKLTSYGQKQLTQLVSETKRLASAFGNKEIPELNGLSRFFDEMAIRLNQDIGHLGGTTGLTVSKAVGSDQSLPGYRAAPGASVPVGLSNEPVEPVGFGEKPKTPNLENLKRDFAPEGNSEHTMSMYDKLIESGDATKEFVYKDAEKKIYQPGVAKQVISDAANSMKEEGYPDLAEKLTMMLNPENLTHDQVMTAARKLIEQASSPSAPEEFKGFTDLSTTILDKLTGKSTISKQFISDLTNSGGVKQTEREIIRNVLEEYPGVSTIPVKEFAEKVKAELLPLDIHPSPDLKYEHVTLPEELRGEVSNYDEHIYQSPIKTSAGDAHFSDEGVDDYFGHTRIEDLPSEDPNMPTYSQGITRRVIEVQSDLYQKGGIESESRGISEIRNHGYKDIADAKEAGIKRLQQYDNPSAHFRMVREEIKHAAEDLKKFLQFPTGETAMKIEGLGEATQWSIFKDGKHVLTLNPQLLNDRMIGMTIRPTNQAGDDWVITGILGNGKFRAVPALKIFPNESGSLKAEWGYKPAPNKKNYVYKENDSETFDISGKVDTNNPIYRFYEKDLARYLKNNFEAKRITDKKGVTWWQVDVKPEAAKKPVTAFKKPIFSKQSGPRADKETIKKLIFRDIPEKEVRLIFRDKLIDGDATGQYTSVRDAVKGVLKPLIELYEEGGQVEVKTAFHEAGHYMFDNFLTAREKQAAFDLAEKEISITDRAKYFTTGYRGKNVVLEEYLMDKYAEQKAKEAGFKGPLKGIFEKIDSIIKDIIAKVKKVLNRIKEIPNREGGFARTPDFGPEKPPLSKEEKLAQAKQTLADAEKKLKIQPTQADEIITTNKEDRLLIEKALKEMNRISQKQSFLKSVEIKLPKEMEFKAAELIARKEALDDNPFKRVVRFMARRGEFKGTLPEVTGKGKGLFSRKGDQILSEITGIDDTEQARKAFDAYVAQRKSWEKDMVAFQMEKQALLSEARAKRDTILGEKKVEKMTNRTEKHISDILNTEEKKKAAIERARVAELASREKIKVVEDARARYEDLVKKAHLSDAEKKGILAKFRAIFSPIEQTDPETKQIYLDWETSKLKAKEEGNDVYEKFKEKPDNDIPSIIEYEAGKKTPWIRDAFDNMFHDAKQAGLDLNYKEDYIPHVYKEKSEVIKKAVIKYMEDQRVAKEVIEEFKKTGDVPDTIAIRLKMRPSFQRIRTFPDYATAMKYNLTPRFNTVAEHLAFYHEEMGKALANRKLIDSLISQGKLLDGYDAPESWVEVKLPGGLRRNYYANKNLADALNGQFRDEDNLSFTQEVFKRVSGVSKAMQEIKLSAGIPGSNVNFFSIGQAIKMLTTGVGELSKLNVRGANTSLKASVAFLRANFNKLSIDWMKKNKKYIDLMAENNIPMMNRVDDYTQSYRQWKSILTKRSLKEGIRSLKTVGEDFATKELFKTPLKQIGKGIVDLLDSRAVGIGKDIFDKSFNEKTFQSMMPQMQIQVFKDLYEKAIEGGMPEETAAEFAAKAVRNEFGLLNDLGRTATVRDVFSSLFFAPRFREGIINTFVNAGKSYTSEAFNPSFARNRSFIVGMILTFIAYNYINQRMNGGDNMWDNEAGHEFDLKIPLPNGKIVYTSFMPSVLSFIRNMGSAVLNFAKGDNSTALQKAGSLFSMPVKVASEIISNKDFFGRPIYDIVDTPTQKATKAIEYMGLSVTHPYFSELVKYFEDKQDIFQTTVMMTELPLKFSTEEKAVISDHYEAKKAKSELNARERASIKDIVDTYDNVQKLKTEGNTGAIETIINGLSQEDYDQYQVVMKYEQIQALKKAKDSATAKALGDTLTDEQFLQYQAIKSIRTTEKTKATLDKKLKAETKPKFEAGQTLDNRTLSESVKVYANAIGTDPVTAFNRIFTGQRIRRVDNDTIIVDRLPLFASSKVKSDRGATSDLRLDHTIPLELGGDNSDSNLKLVPVDVWKSYTPVENFLGKLIRNGKISKSEAQSLIKDFKDGNIKAEDIMKL